MFPQSTESIIVLAVACFIGFLIGQWIKNRGKKSVTGSETVTRLETAHQRKRVSKKERIKARRQ
jgi:hypothetical protein